MACRSRRAGTPRSTRACTSYWRCERRRSSAPPTPCASRLSPMTSARRARRASAGRAITGTRLKVPNAYRELAVLAARHHTLVHRAAELKPATVLTLLEDCDAFRRSERFAELLLACEADARGRAGREGEPYPQAGYLRAALEAAAAVTLSEDDRRGLPGPRIGEEVRRRRLAAVSAVKDGARAPP